MPAQGRLINVRVDAATAAAIDRRITADGGTVSETVRNLIEQGLGKQSTTQETAHTAQYRAAALAQLSEAASLMRRLGNIYVYALKAHRAVSDDEERARRDALHAVEAAARRIIEQ